MTATSEPGRGSTFRLDLALPTASAEAGESVSVASGEEGHAAPGGNACGGRDPGMGPAFDTVAVHDAPKPAPLPANGALVLVADDNGVNRMVASRALERAGCRVETACDGTRAVAAFERTGPHLILMDVSMPGMDRLEATRAIRAIERRMDGAPTPIAALSAQVGATHDARCREAGMHEVIGKPFKRSDLAEALACLVRQFGPVPEERDRDDVPRVRAAS